MKKAAAVCLALFLFVALAAPALAEHDHILNNGTVTTPPTCTGDGVMEYACLVPGCEYRCTVILPAAGHRWELKEEFSQPTCDGNGLCRMVCPVCGASELTYPRRLGHRMEKGAVISVPDCTNFGITEFVCSRENCGHKENLLFPALGHWYDPAQDTVTLAPTCTSTGSAKRVCLRCGHEEEYRLPALAHDWSEPETVKEPTESVSGTRRITCRSCGYSIVQTIPALGTKFAVRLPSGTGYLLDPSGEHILRADGELRFTVTIQDGWKKGESFSVEADRAVVEEQPDGSYLLRRVESSTVVRVTGLVRE